MEVSKHSDFAPFFLRILILLRSWVLSRVNDPNRGHFPDVSIFHQLL